MGPFNRLTLDNDWRDETHYCADRDVVLLTTDEKIGKDVTDTTHTNTFLWRVGPNHQLRVHWPYSSDVDIGSRCKWEVYEVQQDWMVVSYNQCLKCVYNINYARWCGRVVTASNCRFHMTTPDAVQLFCYSTENLDPSFT